MAVAPAQRGPRATVLQAVGAVEGDSATAVRARWRARLRRNPGDRDAALGLATLDRLLSHYDAAVRGYRALDRDGTAPIDGITAHARTGLAIIVQARGDQRAAAFGFARAAEAARLANEPALEVQSLLGLARARARLVGATAALALLDSIAPMVPTSDVRLRAMYEAGRATILSQLGRPEAQQVALACIEEARRAATARLEAACYQPIVTDAERRGDTKPAIDLLARVAVLNRRAHDDWSLANTLQWQGHLLSTRGEYGAAQLALRQAVSSAEASGNAAALAWASLRLARISRFAQDRAAAVAQLARSVAAFQRQGDVAGLMEARGLEVTLAADAGDYLRAHRLATEQLEWARRTARPRLEFTALVAQATLAERQRDWTTALARLDSANAVMRRHEMTGWVDVLWYHQGLIALRRTRLAPAEGFFRANLDVLDPMQQVYRYRTRARLADVYARRGELARAERELASAGAELDAWRATLTDDELRVAAFQTGEDEDPDLGVPRVIAALAAGGRVEGAFALAERRRARELADRMVQADALGDSHASAARLRAQWQSYHQPAADIASLIPDDSTALLEYVTGTHGAPTTVFVLTRAGNEASAQTLLSAHVVTPADSLADGIARFAALLESGGDPRPLARALGAALLDPPLATVGPRTSRIVIVPDGPLHNLPFDALRLANGRYAVERYAVGTAPSAAVVAALWRRPRATADSAPVRLLAFGDPAFATTGVRRPHAGHEAGRAVYREALDSAFHLPRLAESGREARLVAAYAPDAVVRLREEASEAFLKHAPLSAYRVIHFATHALVDERSVERTALALAPGGGESGFVPPGDLAALRLDADLVVLSACRTANGVVVTGEGVQGLTAPLLQAGARAVVATGWRVEDRRTLAFVERFYAGLAERRPVVEALRAAKLDAIRRGAPPSEWAAFTVVGNPLVTVPLQSPDPTGRWWLAGTLAAVATAGGAAVLRRNRILRSLEGGARRSELRLSALGSRLSATAAGGTPRRQVDVLHAEGFRMNTRAESRGPRAES